MKDIYYRSKPMFGLSQGVMNLIEDGIIYALMVEHGHIEDGQGFIEMPDASGEIKTVNWRFHPKVKEMQDHPELETRVVELARKTAWLRGKTLDGKYPPLS